MAGELINPLRQSANPAQPEVAIEQSTTAVGEYIDQLESTGQVAALHALTRFVVDRAKARGEYLLVEVTETQRVKKLR